MWKLPYHQVVLSSKLIKDLTHFVGFSYVANISQKSMIYINTEQRQNTLQK